MISLSPIHRILLLISANRDVQPAYDLALIMPAFMRCRLMREHAARKTAGIRLVFQKQAAG
jgi:hypothetical protein